MNALLLSFYMGALEAELLFAPASEFSVRMATFYCRWVMALEAVDEAAT